jgi:hypothetical protein
MIFVVIDDLSLDAGQGGQFLTGVKKIGGSFRLHHCGRCPSDNLPISWIEKTKQTENRGKMAFNLGGPS